MLAAYCVRGVLVKKLVLLLVPKCKAFSVGPRHLSGKVANKRDTHECSMLVVNIPNQTRGDSLQDTHHKMLFPWLTRGQLCVSGKLEN